MAKATGSGVGLGGPQQQRQDSPMADEMFDGQVRINQFKPVLNDTHQNVSF